MVGRELPGSLAEETRFGEAPGQPHGDAGRGSVEVGLTPVGRRRRRVPAVGWRARQLPRAICRAIAEVLARSACSISTTDADAEARRCRRVTTVGEPIDVGANPVSWFEDSPVLQPLTAAGANHLRLVLLPGSATGTIQAAVFEARSLRRSLTTGGAGAFRAASVRAQRLVRDRCGIGIDVAAGITGFRARSPRIGA